MARFSLTCLSWQVISALHGHNPTVSNQLRYALSRESVCTTTGRGLRPLRCGGNPPRRASLVILLGVNSNCPNSGECIALQQGLKNKQMFVIINEAGK